MPCNPSLSSTREKPLAMYIFAKSKAVIDKMIVEVPSGGVTVNDTVNVCTWRVRNEEGVEGGGKELATQ